MLAYAKNIVPYQSRQRMRAWFGLTRNLYELAENYLYDLMQFAIHSTALNFINTRQQQQSWIDADFHKLEKGLSLSSPRPGFGKTVAERLIRNLSVYRESYTDDMSVQNAISVLEAYMAFNVTYSVIYEEIFEDIRKLLPFRGHDAKGGYAVQSRTEWLKNAKHDLMPFFSSRRSVRDFSEQIVSIDDIKTAVEMAMYTPTVCNRQAAKVHAYTNPKEIQSVISCQMGNAGFGKDVRALLMVTVDRQTFFSACERNQCWIDGGLFSMSLIYALHSLGLGTCCLNWSVNKQRDQLLRHKVNLKESDAVIMMIAVGHLKETFKVAQSARKNLSHFLVDGIQT